jgi:hypothetical protein
MRVRLKILLDRIFLPRWIVLFLDLILVAMVFVLTYLLRLNLVRLPADVPQLTFQLLASLPFFMAASYITKSHHGILPPNQPLRYLSGPEYPLSVYRRTVYHLPDRKVVFTGPENSRLGHCGAILYIGRDPYRIPPSGRVPLAQPGPQTQTRHQPDDLGRRLMGQITKSVVDKDDNLHYNLVGFIDDNPQLHRKTVKGLMIYSPEETFGRIIDKENVKEIIIGITPTRSPRNARVRSSTSASPGEYA